VEIKDCGVTPSRPGLLSGNCLTGTARSRDLAIAAWFRWLWLGGFLLATAWFAWFYLPLLTRLLAWQVPD
jgi:hypothetical protein